MTPIANVLTGLVALAPTQPFPRGLDCDMSLVARKRA
jgi:hypothetical protein